MEKIDAVQIYRKNIRNVDVDDIYLFLINQKFGKRKLISKTNRLVLNAIIALVKSGCIDHSLSEANTLIQLKNERIRGYGISKGCSIGSACTCELCKTKIIDQNYCVLTSFVEGYRGCPLFHEQCAVSVMNFAEEKIAELSKPFIYQQIFLFKQLPIYENLVKDVFFYIFKLFLETS